MMQNNNFSVFQPNRLKEAREFRGYSQSAFAEMLNKSRNAISLFEKGSCIPERNVLSQISQILRIPSDFFYKENTKSAKISSSVYFRRLLSANKSHRVMAERRLELLGEIFAQLNHFLEFPKINLIDHNAPAFHSYDIEEFDAIATELRRFWGLNDNPIGNMINLLETNGIIVGRFNITNTLDAFSSWISINKEQRTFVLLDQLKNSTGRSRFNAAHEVAHLILHKNITHEEISNKTLHTEMERQANLFASAFLLPKETFGRVLRNSRLNIGELLRLKKEWGVSIQAMIMRGSQLDLISENQKIYLFKKINQLGYRTRDPADDDLKSENPNLIKDALQKVFDHKVIDPYDFYKSLSISISDITELTEIDASYFENIPKEIYNYGNVINLSTLKSLRS